MRIHEAVPELSSYPVAVPDDWDLLSDVGNLGALRYEAVKQALERIAPVESNGEPLWFRLEEVEVSSTDDQLGIAAEYLTVEVEGFNRSARRPYRDSYRKEKLFPDPAHLIMHRAEYEIWHHSLERLTEVLASKLETIIITPTSRLQRPWEAIHAHELCDAEF